jgi:hypothetical protein
MIKTSIFTRSVIALAACLWVSLAFGQANNSSNWQTPGNQVVGGAVQMCINTAGNAVPCSTAVAGAAGFPNGATPVNAFATGTTAGATATLPAAAGKTTYVCGFHYEPGTATAAVTTNLTITNLLNGTFTSSVNSPATAATATAGPVVSQVFTPCLPANAVNTTLPVAGGSLGAGGVNQNVNAWGYQL